MLSFHFVPQFAIWVRGILLEDHIPLELDRSGLTFDLFGIWSSMKIPLSLVAQCL